jgi:hypothetical protein
MKKLIAVICFMLATSPLALAQDKGTADATKAAPATTAKKPPTEKQKAQQDKMKSCSKDASDKKLKGDERKKFMSGCMSAQPKADGDKAPAKK